VFRWLYSIYTTQTFNLVSSRTDYFLKSEIGFLSTVRVSNFPSENPPLLFVSAADVNNFVFGGVNIFVI